MSTSNEQVEGKNTSEFKKVNKEDFRSFDDLLAQNGALSFEKQRFFGEIIGSNSWKFDMDKGAISFGNNLFFPVQILGTISFASKTWMWGWANSQSGIPDNLLIQSKKLKALGEEKAIKELSDAQFTVSEMFDHKMGMVACGYFGAGGYYSANYGQGTLVVTIGQEKILDVEKDEVETILTTYPQLIQSIEVDHKEAFKNYLIDKGYLLKIQDRIIEGLKNDTVITAEFDELGRLKQLKT